MGLTNLQQLFLGSKQAPLAGQNATVFVAVTVAD
jgi:hypothetical protein